ncbi:MAG: hypothetical protein IJ060_05495 [Oscillospiraceae bacterium]|nr:hypothetical protein [Oscillospiraceae bacterium]
MLYIKKERRKLLLVIGFIGTALFAAGDVLLQSFSKSGETILLIMRTSVKDMPAGRLYFTLLTGIIAAPFLYLGLCAMDSDLRDRLKDRKGKMYRCFQIGAVIGVLSFFAAHSVCAVLMMAVKQALLCGISPETVETMYRTPFLVSFAATNLWVTVTELCLSAAFIYFVLKRILPLPGAAVLLNTAGFYIIFHAAAALLTALTGNEIFSLLANSGASLGLGAMFLAAAYACGKA